MKICGFTIIKNATINQYPIVEAIKSLLPIVDKMIVLLGDSEDDTNTLIEAIGSPKIELHYSVWDKKINQSGSVLAVETNKAFDLIPNEFDWIFYIQADEIIHEDDYPVILKDAQKNINNTKIDGLLFNFVQFYGTYDYIGDSRRWYHKEVRLLKNNKQIRSYRDAQGFRKGRKKLLVKKSSARVFHYGWVKSPRHIIEKQRHISQYWDNFDSSAAFSRELFDFNEIDSIQKFKGTHPAVMNDRIKKQNWNVELNTKRKKFSLKEGFLYYFEKITGKRLFEFRNYKIIQ